MAIPHLRPVLRLKNPVQLTSVQFLYRGGPIIAG